MLVILCCHPFCCGGEFAHAHLSNLIDLRAKAFSRRNLATVASTLAYATTNPHHYNAQLYSAMVMIRHSSQS